MTGESVELQDLRWAPVAARHRSLRQAAETPNIRQSTLSRRLRDPEYQRGVILFERTNGGTHPTVVALDFLEAAHRILDEIDAACQKLKTQSRGRRPIDN
jgi:DNA-binding transcriptional LysR family regulator